MSSLLLPLVEAALESLHTPLERSIRTLEPLATRVFSQRHAVDVYESGNTLVVRMEIPGYDKSGLKLRLDGNNTLIISAQKQEKADEKNVHYYRSEISLQALEKSVALPKPVRMNESAATLTNGVLEVYLSKIAGEQGEIPID